MKKPVIPHKYTTLLFHISLGDTVSLEILEEHLNKLKKRTEVFNIRVNTNDYKLRILYNTLSNENNSDYEAELKMFNSNLVNYNQYIDQLLIEREVLQKDIKKYLACDNHKDNCENCKVL